MATDYPCNFQYTSSTNTLSWTECAGAEEYQIEVAPYQTSDWEIVYIGGGNHCPLNISSGVYYTKGQVKKPPTGIYSPTETITVD